MKITKILLSILLISALLAGCVSAGQTLPGTTQNMQQPNSTATKTEPQQTQSDGNDTPTTQTTVTEPPVTEPPVTEPPVTEPAATEPEKILAPDFTVLDAEGNEVKLSDFIGQPIILNFWASWCFPCLSELPHFNAKYQEYGDQIQFLMVNVTAYDSVADANSVINQRGYVFPVFYDTEASGADAYEVSGIPVTYVIDAEGYIIEEVLGSMSAKELQKLIDKLLGTA